MLFISLLHITTRGIRCLTTDIRIGTDLDYRSFSTCRLSPLHLLLQAVLMTGTTMETLLAVASRPIDLHVVIPEQGKPPDAMTGERCRVGQR